MKSIQEKCFEKIESAEKDINDVKRYLKTNEAILTGESTPVDKMTDVIGENASIGDRRNIVFTATHIIYGRGKAAVTSTVMKTEFGKIAEMVQTVETEQTPLEKKLGNFSRFVGAAFLPRSVGAASCRDPWEGHSCPDRDKNVAPTGYPPAAS